MSASRGDLRRHAKAPHHAPSWFGVAGSADEIVDEALRAHEKDWRPSDIGDSDFGNGPATQPEQAFERDAQRSAFLRLYRAFIGARAALGLALFGTEVIIASFSTGGRGESLGLCAVYAATTLSQWLLPTLLGGLPQAATRGLDRRQWLSTIGVDLVAFGLLHAMTGGAGFNTAALLVLPALMAGVLTTRRQSLAVAAAASLMLLGQAGLDIAAGSETFLTLTRAGLAGGGLFVVAVLAGELAARLDREERSARGSQEMARQQAQLNRLVLDEMQEGVLVVDRRGRVRAANPAAGELFGEPRLASGDDLALRGVPGWRPLVQAVERAFIDGAWPEAGRDLSLPLRGGASRPLRLRVRFTRRQEGLDEATPEEFCVLFVEDLRRVQARTQQEKLAAMGRVSAGIAHEIRNPLAAIVQANALLSEDASTNEQRQLTRMVSENADRLRRIVDDVLEVAAGQEERTPAPLELNAAVAGVCSEWARTEGLRMGEASPVRVTLPPEPIGVSFDGDHLRRVLVNLLDNALRHGSRAPGSVEVVVSADEVVPQLVVASDGDPIPADVERFLFEPFFSTRSRGTGLGLYICRELCQRYGASIDYAAHAPPRRLHKVFTVRMRRGPLPTTDARLPLTT